MGHAALVPLTGIAAKGAGDGKAGKRSHRRDDDQARGAVTGQGARYVLAFGTVGVIALFAVVYLYYFV